MSFICGKSKKRLILAALLFALCLAGALRTTAGAENVVTSAGKAAKGKWVRTGKGIRYRYTSNGKYIKSAWKKINSSVYRFNSDGYAETGWFTFEGKRYCAASDGKLYIRKWIRKSGRYYFVGSDGALKKNRMFKFGGKYYYVDKSGARADSAWVSYGGKRYYFGQDGVRLESMWLRSGGKFYYFGRTGAMVSRKWVGSYYVGADGARKTNCVVGGYYLDSTGKKTVKVFRGDYIFVGDSRTVGMRLAVSPGNTLYIAKESMGYSWLKSTGGPQLKLYLNANPNVKVVLALGVNDLGNVQSYISYYRALIKSYPRTEFYVLSANPVDEKKASAHGYTIKNKQITSTFNKPMLKALGWEHFISTYAYLMRKGFATSDGLHYTAQEYRELYNYVIKKIK